MRIAFCGNFNPEHSTENDLLKSLRILKHTVVTFQESETIRERITGFDIVLWCHTHGWDPDGKRRRTIFGDIPYVAFTLDLFRGLARHDSNYVKTHPWFTCDYFFQPDEPDWLIEQGVKAHFSAPAILETSCYAAAPDPLHPAYGKIVFVGSYDYHPEWPWRQQLIEFLKEEYGDRFAHYDHNSGMRGHALNVLYASASVVVGDSCFAKATSRYTSDRLYESLGRGANLVYPWISYGFDPHPYLFPYVLGEFENLKEVIDGGSKWRPDPEKQVAMIRNGQTYTDRMRAMLEVVKP